MKKTLPALITLVSIFCIAGCSSTQLASTGLDSFDDTLELAKQVFSTGDGMLIDPYMDYSGLTQKEIDQFREKRLAKIRGKQIGEISIWDSTEYKSLVSDGQLSRWEWSHYPDKVILIRELDNDPHRFVGLIFGLIERDEEWLFCRAYIPED